MVYMGFWPWRVAGAGTVDAAHYEDLAGRLYDLLITLQDRLDGEQARLCTISSRPANTA
jgi:hypothetical protein